MSLASILVSLAVAIVAIAYVARPFRRDEPDWEHAIAQWVDTLEDAEDAAVNFCPQCGRRVAPDHRFCPGCGRALPASEAAE